MKAIFAFVALLAVVNAQWLPPYSHVDSGAINTKYIDKTVFETVSQLPPLKSLVELISMAGYENYVQVLSNPDEDLTLFAPDNDAFAYAGVNPSDLGVIVPILEYHLLNASTMSSDLKLVNFARSRLSNDSFVNLNGDAQVVQIHKLLGKVMIPFGIPGEATFTANVVTADIVCSNGVIHVIDKILLPPNITAVLAYRAGLTAFLSVLHHYDMLHTVDAHANVTIFAPTNPAFFAIDFTKLTRDQAQAILQYHIVPTVLYSPQLSTGTFPTLLGEDLKISVSFFGTTVNHACVSRPNLLISNGVIHIIDKVLIPPSMQHLHIVDDAHHA